MEYLTKSTLFSPDETKNRNYTVWKDGSVSITCSLCFKEDKLEEGDKWNGWLKNNPETRNAYRCYECWKKFEDTGKGMKQEAREEKIQGRQAYNLANAAILAEGLKPTDKEFFKKLKKYQELYDQDLNNY